MTETQCPRCLSHFSRFQRLKSHLERKNKCQIMNPKYTSELERFCLQATDSQISQEIANERKFICAICGIMFTRKYNLDRHAKHHCEQIIKDINLDQFQPPIGSDRHNVKLIDSLAKKIKELEDKLENNYTELKDKSSNVHNNILQVVCVGNNQNYLDMLTEQWGDYDRALNFIKDCALSHLTGDCKLLQKIYFENRSDAPIRFLDRAKGNLEYVDENHQKVIDYKGQRLGRILANNLQNSYLKGVNYLIDKNQLNHQCSKKFIDDYDVESWNNHIYELSDIKYQKKIINCLDIPS